MPSFDRTKIGDVRPNQMITTFGPGAIVDVIRDSVTILDTSYWRKVNRLQTDVSHPTLVSIIFTNQKARHSTTFPQYLSLIPTFALIRSAVIFLTFVSTLISSNICVRAWTAPCVTSLLTLQDLSLCAHRGIWMISPGDGGYIKATAIVRKNSISVLPVVHPLWAIWL